MPAKQAAPKYRVESLVPMPERRSHECPYPFLDMKRGDSFLVPCDVQKAATVRARVYSRSVRFGKNNNGCKFLTRIVDGGVRCWRYE